MAYVITKNKFAPKAKELSEYDNSHGIIYRQCNFRCKYCELRNRPSSDFHEYTEEQLKEQFASLIPYGKNFKFTGGEPTLNPHLERDLSLARGFGGVIFLDTNGSRPAIVERLLEQKLVDVLGISLKGLTKKEALCNSGIIRPDLVWDNVFQTVKLSNKFLQVRTIVTIVIHDELDLDITLENFKKLMEQYPNVILKINNLMENPETAKNGMRMISKQKLMHGVDTFLLKYTYLRGRLIVIDEDGAVEDFHKIIFK